MTVGEQRPDPQNPVSYTHLYLLTDHTQFYEKCGWSFYTMVQGDDGSPERLYRTNS